ncbi:amino acid/polyamine transporter I [Aspergillus pseudonomiae]|uniref:Amino acid/polyamine transporter I n=1 Tax=Aspergillus pseudonomiae TaxID=1506151 RepID=A0A5N7CUW1_9EURO|nr:amino acid/polyamine transporter I [Aspergillus pseudonomiae]KAE8397972.1 amino acid/polyamine transporter I [Aspergillus pseudonomiae]
MDKQQYKCEDRIPLPELGQQTFSNNVNDNRDLARVGKLPSLQRRFGFLSILGFSCTVLATWEGVLSTFILPLKNGGSAGAVYTYLFVWFSTLCTLATLSELVSMAPTSGGQYHWVAILAPRWCHKFLSFITAWLVILGWLGAFASGVYMASSQIMGFVTITHTAFQPQPYQVMLLYWAYVAFAMFINVGTGRLLPKFEGFVLILHIAGFFVILIPLSYLGDHVSANEVFGSFNNEGGWPSLGLSLFVGMLGSNFAFTGCDAAIHMTEETRNATVTIPRSIMMSIVLNGSLGFGILLVTLFNLQDVDHVLNSPTGYPYIQIFLNATGSIPGSIAMASIVPISGVATASGNLAAASRMVWSFSRDRGTPWWILLSKVDSRRIPFYSITAIVIAALLLSLIILWSEAVLNAVVSLTVSSLFSSYLIAAALLLYHRLTGGIRHCGDTMLVVNTTGAPLSWGPFHIPRKWGIATNAFTVCYLTIAVIFSFWPSDVHVNVSSMNWAIAPTGGTVLFGILYYITHAKGTFTGPVVEVC